MRLSWEGRLLNPRFWSAGTPTFPEFNARRQSQAYTVGEARRLRSLPRRCGRDLFPGS